MMSSERAQYSVDLIIDLAFSIGCCDCTLSVRILLLGNVRCPEHFSCDPEGQSPREVQSAIPVDVSVLMLRFNL